MRSEILSLQKELKEISRHIENLNKPKEIYDLSILSVEELKRLGFIVGKLPQGITTEESIHYLTPMEHTDLVNILIKSSNTSPENVELSETRNLAGGNKNDG